MSTTYRDYILNDYLEAGWFDRERDVLQAIIDCLPTNGTTYVSTEHYHAKLGVPDGTIDPVVQCALAGTSIFTATGVLGLYVRNSDKVTQLAGTDAPTWKTADYNVLALQGNAFIDASATELDLVRNAYYDITDSRWEFVANAVCTRYRQSASIHYFYRATSGAAGNPVTWVEMMRIEDSNIYCQSVIHAAMVCASTSDGSDTSLLQLGGGGYWGTGRGGSISLYGNEYGGGVGGLVSIQAATATGDITFQTNAGEVFLLKANGDVYLPRFFGTPGTLTVDAAGKIVVA